MVLTMGLFFFHGVSLSRHIYSFEVAMANGIVPLDKYCLISPLFGTYTAGKAKLSALRCATKIDVWSLNILASLNGFEPQPVIIVGCRFA